MGTGKETTNWQVGVADRVITPSESMWMAGFGARDRPSQGVHHDLHAKAIALTDEDGNRLVIVSLEILFVGRSLRERVVEACAAAYDLPADRLLLGATHTHQGPVTRTATVERERTDGTVERVPKQDGSVNFIPIEKYDIADEYREKTVRYTEFLEETVIELVGDALADQQPALLEYAYGRCGSAVCRRRPAEDQIHFSPYAAGPVDHRVPVLVATDPATEGNAAVQALVFGYACHTTVQFLDEFSGDWAGYTQRMLEDRFPNATALFLQGCGGDQKAYPQREQEYTEAHARAVTLGVEAALESERYPVGGPVRTVYDEIDIPFEGPPSPEEIAALRDSDDPTERWRGTHLDKVREEAGEIPTRYPYPIHAIGFGTELTLVALAGEVLAGYSLRLKDEIPGHVWPAAYANNAFTYVPTRDAMAAGGYEGETIIGHTTLPGRWEPDLEDRIVSNARALADRVRTP